MDEVDDVDELGPVDSVVSLVVYQLYDLRERRPVSLSEESLVELVGQRGPSLLRWGGVTPTRSLSGQPSSLAIDPLSRCARTGLVRADRRA